MASILVRGLSSQPGLKRVVLQPQGAERAVRAAMVSLGWQCTDSAMVEERSKFYTIECWERGQHAQPWSDADLRWGRVVREKPDPLFHKMLFKQLRDAEMAESKLLHQAPPEHPDAAQLRSLKAFIVQELERLGYKASR